MLTSEQITLRGLGRISVYAGGTACQLCFEILRYSNDTKESSFSVGLWGIKEEDVNMVKQIVQNTFEAVVQ